jgi:hypothetical protein
MKKMCSFVFIFQYFRLFTGRGKDIALLLWGGGSSEIAVH